MQAKRTLQHDLTFSMSFCCQSESEPARSLSRFPADTDFGDMLHSMQHGVLPHLSLDPSGPGNEICTDKFSLMKAWGALECPEVDI